MIIERGPFDTPEAVFEYPFTRDEVTKNLNTLHYIVMDYVREGVKAKGMATLIKQVRAVLRWMGGAGDWPAEVCGPPEGDNHKVWIYREVHPSSIPVSMSELLEDCLTCWLDQAVIAKINGVALRGQGYPDKKTIAELLRGLNQLKK